MIWILQDGGFLIQETYSILMILLMILFDHISAFIRHCWSGLWGNEEKTALSTFDLKASCDNDSLLFVV